MNRFTAIIAALLLTAAPQIFAALPDKASGGTMLTGTEFPGAEFQLPGGGQFFFASDRKSFRPDRRVFDAAALEIELRATGDDPEPVDGVMFFKTKEGLWFQSVEEFHLTPGEWSVLRCRTDQPGRNWRGVDHGGVFDAEYASKMFEWGVSIYGGKPRKITLECRRMEFTGAREPRTLAVVDWRIPESGEVNRQFRSRFGISREFFNPFDPDEVSVDFQITCPDGGKKSVPCFYGRDFIRSHHHTRETLVPRGQSFWEFRFTPTAAGEHRFSITVNDKRTGESLTTAERVFTARPGNAPGRVRVSRSNPEFFELSTGEFFYPVALNIHTNCDTRSELGLDFGHLPDRGTLDYDDYLAACARSGINTVEVWMAGWTAALEHDVRRNDYYGVGFYNTAAAWELDHIIDTAEKLGIKINLVLDNHGRLTNRVDPEWCENPLNSTSEYAAANGGFLAKPEDFFNSAEAARNNFKRSRYIAARWGSAPNLFAIEPWSEVDLVDGARERYDDGSMTAWHVNAARELDSMMQIPAPITAHVCSDYMMQKRFIKLFEPPEMSHYAGDAYRGPTQHLADHMRLYLAEFAAKYTDKPKMITEYGCNPMKGNTPDELHADLHVGLWSSLFTRQAATPFFWWHDFVHFNDYYFHYRAFADFIRGMDLRQGARQYLTLPMETAAPPPEFKYENFALVQGGDRLYGWAFERKAMWSFPKNPADYPQNGGAALTVAPGTLAGGSYQLDCFNTVSGQWIHRSRIDIDPATPTRIELPPFGTDIAFKLTAAVQP